MNNIITQLPETTFFKGKYIQINNDPTIDLSKFWFDWSSDDDKVQFGSYLQKRCTNIKPIKTISDISTKLSSILQKSISTIGSNQTDLLIQKIKQLGLIENYFQMRIYLLKHQNINVQAVDSIINLLNKRFKKERQIIISIESDYDIQEHMKLNIRIDDYHDSFINDIVNINKEISSITKNLNAIIIVTSDFEEPERYGI